MERSIRYCPSCRRTYNHYSGTCPLDGSSLLDLPKSLPDPSTVLHNRYLVLSRIGSGAMGTIFRAYDMRRRIEVALKVMDPSLTNNANAVRRFFLEARAARRLNHPNIVAIYDFGVSWEGYLFIAMECLSGLTLAELLRRKGRLSVGEAIIVALGITEALIHAHENGVVHRDLKPENIFLVTWDRCGLFVKVVDFGIASVADGRSSFAYRGEVLGTPAYMSPEQVRGDLVDGRSDLYSLGILIYEMLTGEPPFLSDDPVEQMKAHLTSPPPPLSPLPVSYTVRRGLERLLDLLLRKRPEERPSNAREVRAMLRQVRDNLALEDASAVGSALFQKALAPLTTVEPFHERSTLILDFESERFHTQETIVLDATGLAGLKTVAKEPSCSGPLAVPSLLKPWTIERNNPFGQSTKSAQTVTLLHMEFEFGLGGQYDPKTLFEPEVQAFVAEALADGATLCDDRPQNSEGVPDFSLRLAFTLNGSNGSTSALALETAKNMARRVARFRKATGLDVKMRAGMATGLVPVNGSYQKGFGLRLSGSYVDFAVRLAEMAEPGQVLMDEKTKAMSDKPLEASEWGSILVRGGNRPVRLFAASLESL